MLTKRFRVMFNNIFKESFLWEKKKKVNNILIITFFIFHKCDIKFFFK